MNKKIEITDENQGERLDKFLAEILTGQTRSQIKKTIEAGLVLINDKPAKVHQFLRTGDVIETRDQITENKTPDNLPPASNFLFPTIIFENHDFIVLEKPEGLLVHATDKKETNTLVDWLLKKYPAMEKVGEQKYRAGIIHRLDRDVSGVMVVAKTNRAFDHLKDQFKDRKIKKEYLALVYGQPREDEGEIDLPIGRSQDGQFVAHPKSNLQDIENKDRYAKTKYKILEKFRDYSLLSVQILTGRTHQIRAHLFAIGHPILGDKIYRPKKNFIHFFIKKVKVINLDRIFLHSTKIGFSDLDNNWVEFESPLPQKLTDFLNEKRKS
ncbi:MAG: RluA family pseudouridine synthase [Candidatus Buchananbacteria bacterium]